MFNWLKLSALWYFILQLSTMDVLARTTMKGAAKCDKHCELQNSVNQQNLERILRLRDIPEGMLSSVSALYIFRRIRFFESVARQGVSFTLTSWIKSVLAAIVISFGLSSSATLFEVGYIFLSRDIATTLIYFHNDLWVALLRHEVKSENPLNLSI